MTEQSASAHTYAKLFPEQLANPCSPDAPESNTGPIAYLHALYQKGLEMEGASTNTSRLTLAHRRPDIGALLLDPGKLEQPVSALTLAIRALTHHAQDRAGPTAYLPEVLASAGQHANLPFNYAHEQVKAVLQYKQIPYFELLQQTQYSYPSFCYEGLRSDELRQVMRNASGFSPALQALLLEEKPLRKTGDDWRKWYGMADIDAKKATASLLDVETFGRRTGLSFEQILEMLAVAGIDDNAAASYSLVRSSNAYRPAGKPVLDRFHYGAAYINARRSTPLTIKDALPGAGIKPQLDSLDYDCLSRMYQMIHLQRALALPFNDVDLLLTSILRAEGQVGNWHLTPSTLRAIGVFRYLNEAYGISAEQFAALVCEVSPFAVGEQVPMLDRVLDGPGAGQLDTLNPLILDDRAFDPADGEDGQFKVVPALAKALGVDEQATRVYLAQVKQAQGLETLSVSLALLSALYRLSRLYRLFQRSAREASALIALLATSGADVLAQLAGTPLISDARGSDVLDTLVALGNLDQWLRQQQILPSVLLAALAPIPTTEVALGSSLLDTLQAQQEMIKVALQPKADESQQQELIATLVMMIFGYQRAESGVSRQHVPSLLSWAGKTAAEVLQSAIVLIGKTGEVSAQTGTKAEKEAKARLEATQLWFKLGRRFALVTLLRLSPGALQALSDNPEWFDLEKTSDKAINLDLCYQLSRFRAWVEVCRANGSDERDATNYLSSHRFTTDSKKVSQAASVLATLIGWPENEVEVACPNIFETVTVEDTRPTFDDFLKTLSQTEKSRYEKLKFAEALKQFVIRRTGAYSSARDAQGFNDKLIEFLNNNPGPLLVNQEQYKKGYKPDYWAAEWEKTQTDVQYGYFPITMEALAGMPQTVSRLVGTPCVPSTISDIDYILRLKRLSEKTGLACNSLLSLSELNETSPYREFEGASQLLMAATDDALREALDKQMRERWRDALAGYLIAHWAPPEPDAKPTVATFDDLSSYCLTDIRVSSEVTTTQLNQAIGSLQHYLSRLYARLEPGYSDTGPSGEAQAEWQHGLGQYGTWKRLIDRYNHPANLIYYANRTNKSVAFQELEVALNQGKMDTSLLHTAICTYLAKFERVSNLQVISGYLDGHDPKQDTYHLIAKTNTTPHEYYWRTLDISLRDDQNRLSPLAWSEWEKIDLAPAGEITQSKSRDKLHDTVRPVVIAGRRYVFWVERGSTDLPDGAKPNKTLPDKRKLSVNFIFQQSDATWSTSNELFCLNGYKNGAWDENLTKDVSFMPGLIVVVQETSEDGLWLTALMHDSAKPLEKGKTPELIRNTDYYLEARDLLLLENKKINDENADKLCESLLTSYINANDIQHPYNGSPTYLALASYSLIRAEVIAKFSSPDNKKIEFQINGCTEPGNKSGIAEKNPDNTEIKVEIFGDGKSIFKDQRLFPFVHYTLTTDIDVGTYKQFKIVVTHRLYKKHKSHTGNWRWDFDHEETMGTSVFEIRPITKADEVWTVSIASNDNQAQYLDLSHVEKLEPALPTHKIRLNTLFGKNLVARASQGVEQVLAWDTQKLQEPDLESGPPVDMDLHGANALYFRELFLHVPALVAMRLTEQQQFEEAEDWYLRYLFNPYRTKADAQGRPAPWGTRPLAQGGTLSSALRKGVDPISRVFTLSRHYQQAIYLSLLENWQLQGDHFYRQLTLSTLNQAWLCYQQAQQLLGPLPEGSNASRWNTVTLASVDGGAFRRPLNGRVLDLHQTLQSRMYNLRHGLTLDGKQLPALDWNSESLDAFDNGRGGVSNLPIPYRSGQVDIPHYRFRQLLPLARAAAQQLSDFGRHYMSLMEEEFNTSLAVQLKAQDIKIADFAIRLQKEAISGVGAKKKVLLLSRDKVLAQKEFLSDLIDVGRSPEEESATAFTWIGNTFRVTSQILNTCSGTVATVTPTIFGLALGGTEPKGVLQAFAEDFITAGMIADAMAAELKTQADYNRRAAEWAFNKAQTEWDLKIIDQQLKETNIELNASTIALAQCEQARINEQETYVSMTTGFTIIPVYNWLVARQEYIYGVAYDAVRSLCLSVEAAWRYEIGDYRRDSFIDTSAWRDNYKGMLVGESLLVNLQQMENEYLARNERRLTIKKSFSLKKKLDSDATKPEEKWAGIFNADAKRTTPLTHSFEFKADDFDKSYPGQYLRQLKYVSVTLVFKADKKVEELCAILKQTGSATLLEPDKNAARSFYPGNDSEKKIKDARENPRLVLRNPRENQQIALSSTVAEDGLGYDAGTWVYELMFHDGRYLPFEGTGAISQWTLELLGDEDLLKDLSIIEDIRFNMVYTAKAGDDEFVKEIGKIRKEPATAKKDNT
ncbi:MAG: Tc toxin subunit A [Candidatus Pseudomonas phytovorans]|uniref:Tc toxin subunit A n=1 Tax=Candidatus Pseudomonas phytovorans TaxID=3121377 RepID=A0AAJ5WN55_9PSED|nr:neuraminidase-like domain-containing protein [Pseudomonas sp.]WEK31605.1 MAG: Tc toxin subunit A [Pseudomonas sp.]